MREHKSFEVVVPASTSNLGSGFDTVSAALDLHLKVRVTPREKGTLLWRAGWEGPLEENILHQALLGTLRQLPGLEQGAEIEMENPIPLKRGLGSSGAAVIAAVLIASRLRGKELSPAQVLRLALPWEGHPDNLAASLLGGWVLSRAEQGEVRAERLPCRLHARLVFAVPEATISTQEARRILPLQYRREDVVFSLQRCALLVHALSTGKKELLREAMQDRLHQPYRASLVAGMQEILAGEKLPPNLQKDLLATAVSGSGPTMLALVEGQAEEVGDWMVRRFREKGLPARYIVCRVDRRGARIRH